LKAKKGQRAKKSTDFTFPNGKRVGLGEVERIWGGQQTNSHLDGSEDMNQLEIIFIAIFITCFAMANAQDLASHQWNDRLVVIISHLETHPDLKKQISELLTDENGLRERRLKVYQVLPDAYKMGLDKQANWKKSEALYARLQRPGADFEVLLIGLDGGVKLRKNEVVKCEELFGLIDQMPMRRAEMRRKGQE
jgi:hypothetical protein